MVVVYEFFGNEPIENVITSMHFKVDKVVYFGYHDALQGRRESTKNFLKKYCGVETVVFHELSRNDLQSVLKTMCTEIQNERGKGSRVYFDITGGESLILVAFGMLSKEFESPMHTYDVPSDKLIELDDGARASISQDVESQKVELNLDRIIEMKGGVINWDLHKNIKEDDGDEFFDDVSKIWKVTKNHIDCWNPFSDFLKSVLIPDANLQVNVKANTVLQVLANSNNSLKTAKKLNCIIDELADEGILLNVKHTDGRYRFCYKNQKIKECLLEGGSILELHVYQCERGEADDCHVGVHIDWDGVIHEESGTDVVNEIDVLSLKGLIPTFISCKSGKMNEKNTLHALYELDTFAKRFGGKYAKKVIVAPQGIVDVYKMRAREMGIEVR